MTLVSTPAVALTKETAEPAVTSKTLPRVDFGIDRDVQVSGETLALLRKFAKVCPGILNIRVQDPLNRYFPNRKGERGHEVLFYGANCLDFDTNVEVPSCGGPSTEQKRQERMMEAFRRALLMHASPLVQLNPQLPPTSGILSFDVTSPSLQPESHTQQPADSQTHQCTS